MDFTIPARVFELCQSIRRFVDERIIPLEARLDESRFRELLPDLEALRGEVRQAGWWAPGLPTDVGGMGLPLLDFAFVSLELGRSPLGHFVFNCQAPDISTVELLHRYATPEQRESWLVPLAAGRIRSCFAMTEPDYPGSNPVWLGTTAVLDGSAYVLNGRKWFATGAEGAAFAVVMAVTDPDKPEHERASMLVVPTDTPGYRLVRNLPVMGAPGQDWASHAELALEQCRVPETALLGPRGAGFKLAQERLGPGRIHHCMRWIGIAERAFDLMCNRAVRRELSPGVRLAEKESVQIAVADSRAEIEASRLMVLRAAWRIDNEGASAAREDVSLIKFHTAAMLQRVLDRAIQVHGGLGLLDDTPLAFWYRQERAARIYDGADEVHRSSVARRILKRYR